MIHLVYILTSFDIGGAEQSVLDIARRLDRKRFAVRVIGVVRGGPLRAEFHEAGIPTDVIGKETRLGLRTIARLTNDLRDTRPDIVHTELFGGDTWGRIAAIRAGVPHIVSTEQNTNVDEQIVKRLIKWGLARHTDRIIAISDAVRSYSIRVDRIPIDRIVVIPNGVDTERFSVRARSVPERPRFLFVGRFVHQKGIETLIDAFAVLRDRLPHAVLDLVGDGPLRPSIQSLLRSYHIEDRVYLYGFHRDTLTHYQRASIVVMPSRWEGLGIVAIEAGACGLPVIASSVGGLREVIVDQETGILVPPDEPQLLADAMHDLALDRPRQILLGHAARRRVEREYDIRRVVERYERLYDELMRAR